ncbi:RagB/SusD family nutrient uptake outer membrane protein [Mangrovibacterium lignilyticum]|uniref:RagB/SusD family nutrient uptake outer membrane protein n=1 Tax=Mangrovibacterium lignilyticum TaxID=2668052 RepID=UPI0013D2DA0C|nr:RagB/SusD family nutrient uptake outer membrane protein [Mangrovibacterium lignilyticum]
MKNLIYLFTILLFATSCSSSFLEESPVGELTEEQVTTAENIESIAISAYSVLNGQFDGASNAYNSPDSNWSFGDVVSDDAYKGGGGTGDQNQIHLMEIFAHDATITDVGRKWSCLYEGIRRANLAIRLLEKSEDFDSALKAQRIGEMKFLRGHYHFEAKKIYNNICWIDETVESTEDYYSISNTDLTSAEQWAKIEADFTDAFNALPSSQDEVGRPTKMAAKAYLTKCYIFESKWTAAADAAQEVIESTQYSLEPNFRDVFLPENDNGPEIVFSVQHSINDGTTSDYSGSISDRLMSPGGSFYANYGFLRPSQNLVNAYRTTADGLPTFDNVELADGDNLDPRVDHTLARPGIPYLDLGVYDWTPREATVYGPYSPKKRMVSANSAYYTSSWPYVNALNYYIIRYADVLLWKAEAEIELDNLDEGMIYINMVRERAKDSEYVQNIDGTGDAANYFIDTYDSFADQDEALAALRMERRLEFAQEGHRFFDLVRWGIAADVMNAYFSSERLIRSHLTNASFVAGKNEYQPIPQTQIDLCTGDMQQNPNY